MKGRELGYEFKKYELAKKSKSRQKSLCTVERIAFEWFYKFKCRNCKKLKKNGLSMTFKNHNITFDKLDKDYRIPYELWLLADPSKDLIDEYLKPSDVFTARQIDEIIGIQFYFH